MNDRTVIYDNQVGRFKCLKNEEYIGQFLAAGRAWDFNEIYNILVDLIPHNKDILDIGAHIGSHTIPYAKCTSGKVHAFDAQTEIYKLLVENIKLNKLGNVVTYHVAVGHTHEKVSIASKVPDGRSAGQSLEYDTDRPINYGGMNLGIGTDFVEMITIDSLNLNNVGYMKLDVQGSEPLVFYGAQETIKKCKPIIYFEHTPHTFPVPDLGFPIPDDAKNFNIFSFTKNLGYLDPVILGDNILLLPSNPQRLDLSKFEKKVYSQNGEDGVLDALFSLLNTTNKYFVEIGTENGSECNTRLLREQGWQGLMLDATYENKDINLHKHLITPENVENILQSYNVPTYFDLLSIDIDSNDFYVWQAINKYRPRVVVIEYNSILGLTDKVVYPMSSWDGTSYFGASILALYNLARKKGYSLVYADNNGVNLFFVRDDCLTYHVLHMNNPFKLFKYPRYGGHPYDFNLRPYTTSLDIL